MKKPKNTDREPSPGIDRQAAGTTVLLLMAGFLMWACSDMAAEVEQDFNPVFTDKDGMIEEIIFLDAEEGILFEQAVEDFTSRIYEKDGQLHLKPSPTGSPPESQWHYLFRQGLHTANEMIRTGEASLEELATPRHYRYEAEAEAETSKSFVPGDTPPDAANTQPPGAWDYTYIGGGLHSLYLSHEAYIWVLAGGTFTSGFLNKIGLGWVSLGLAGVVIISGTHYTIRGQGGGIRIFFWFLGSTPVMWAIYPEAPTDQDLE
jgi:hypothetical protein